MITDLVSVMVRDGEFPPAARAVAGIIVGGTFLVTQILGNEHLDDMEKAYYSVQNNDELSYDEQFMSALRELSYL